MAGPTGVGVRVLPCTIWAKTDTGSKRILHAEEAVLAFNTIC